MLAGDGGEVDRGAADRREGLAPEHADQHRPHDREGVDARIAGPHLAARLGALDQRRRAGRRPSGPPRRARPWRARESCAIRRPPSSPPRRPAIAVTISAKRGRSIRNQVRERQVEREDRRARAPRYWGSPPRRRRRGRCRSWSRNRDRACPSRRRRAPRSPRSARRRSPFSANTSSAAATMSLGPRFLAPPPFRVATPSRDSLINDRSVIKRFARTAVQHFSRRPRVNGLFTKRLP